MNNNPNEWKNPSAPDGTEGRTAPTLRDRRRKQKQNILYLVQLALLTAVIMVLHFSGVAIPAFGTKISLVLIPIALGAMLLGPVAGAILGLIYGCTSIWWISQASRMCCAMCLPPMRPKRKITTSLGRISKHAIITSWCLYMVIL